MTKNTDFKFIFYYCTIARMVNLSLVFMGTGLR